MDKLGEQQRIPSGRVVTRARERLLDRPGVERLQHRLDTGNREGFRVDHLGHGVGDDLHQRAAGAFVLMASADDKRDRVRLHAPGQIGEEPQRRLVGPLGVVDCEQQRCAV
jgi:hypothetical protein